MSECATASAWIRCAPSLTNISPTTDLPLAMPPVSPSFSKGKIPSLVVSPWSLLVRGWWLVIRCSSFAQRHFRVPPKLLGTDQLGMFEPASQLCGFYGVGHQHGDG